MLNIIKNKCTGCEVCIDKCPFDALSMEENKAVVDHDTCTMCGICVKACEFDAIELEKEEKKEKKDKKKPEAEGKDGEGETSSGATIQELVGDIFDKEEE